jgi:crossover junction endodeoxyribonuclease RusA
MPPSANAIWHSNRGHVHKSAAYKAWLKQAGWEARAQHPDKIEGAYRLSIEVTRPDKRHRDLDNLIKPISDLLTGLGVIRDDSECEEISARWITAGYGRDRPHSADVNNTKSAGPPVVASDDPAGDSISGERYRLFVTIEAS